MLVAPQLEVGERVRAVSPHELACHLTGLGVRKITRSSKRPKDEVTDDDDRHNPD